MAYTLNTKSLHNRQKIYILHLYKLFLLLHLFHPLFYYRLHIYVVLFYNHTCLPLMDNIYSIMLIASIPFPIYLYPPWVLIILNTLTFLNNWAGSSIFLVFLCYFLVKHQTTIFLIMLCQPLE